MLKTKFKHLTYRTRITGALVVFVTMAITLMGWFSYTTTKKALEKEAFDKLIVVRETMKQDIEHDFQMQLNLLDDVKQNLRYTQGLPLFTDAFQKGTGSKAYRQLADVRDPGFARYADVHGYHDIFLISADGRVVYTLMKEPELGKNLLDPQTDEITLYEVFHQSKQGNVITDFYYDTDNIPPEAVMLIATPLYDAGGSYMGSAAFQISTDHINNLMSMDQRWKEFGLGETGEMYLVGTDYKIRNDCRTFIENSEDYFNKMKAFGHSNEILNSIRTKQTSILLQHYENDAVVAALHGESGVRFINNYAKELVVSAYAPINIPGLNWAIIVDINAEEVYVAVRLLRNSYLLFWVVSMPLSLLIAYILGGILIKRVQSVADKAQLIALGKEFEEEEEEEEEVRDELQLIENSLKMIVRSFRGITEQAKTITEGDYTGKIAPRSEHDELAASFNVMGKKLAQTVGYNENIIRSMTDALFSLDLDATIRTVNPAACEMLGYTEDELLGLPVGKVFEEEEFSQKVLSLFGKRLQNIIDTDLNRFYTLMDDAPIGGLQVNNRGVITRANPQICALFGYTEKEIVGQPIHILLPKKYQKKHETQTSGFMEKNESRIMGQDRILEGQHKDGTIIQVEVALVPVEIEGEKSVISLVRNIKKDTAWEIIKMTKFGKLFEEVEEQATKSRPSGKEPAFDKSTADRPAKGTAGREEDAFRNLEQTLKRKDGSTLPVLIRGAVMRETLSAELPAVNVAKRNEQITGVVFVATDITEQKKASEAEHALAEERERSRNVILNILERQNRTLVRAQESDRLKNVFLGTMSHEVRTPLNAVLGFSHLLRDSMGESLTGEQQKFFDSIRDSSERLKNLIDDVLDISRIEAGKDILKPEATSADELVKSCVNEIRVPCSEKELKLVENYKAPDLYVMVDRLRYQQAVANILQNAVKFTREGSITITTVMRDSEYAVSVSDTGIGIKKEFKPFLFTLFRQAEDGYERSYEGAGLGLSISQRLIDAMGGRVEVEGEEGKGSTFTIYFPVSSDPVVKEEPKKEVIKEKSPISGEVIDKPLTVLILEDNPANLDYIGFIIKKLKHKYISAESGEDALELLKGRSVDFMLIDISLAGGMSGIEFLKQINGEKRFRKIPKVAVTAHAMKGKREEFLEEGFDDYLAKPFTLDELKLVIERNYTANN